jgi:hypothetical protein
MELYEGLDRDGKLMLSPEGAASIADYEISQGRPVSRYVIDEIARHLRPLGPPTAQACDAFPNPMIRDRNEFRSTDIERFSANGSGSSESGSPALALS